MARIPMAENEWALYLPFDHDDIRVYIDSLFLEGLLSPSAAGGK